MGSLFQLRSYWRQPFSEEEFSPSCIGVGDLDNQNAGDKIAIGSFQGIFRIFEPSSSPMPDSISPEDMLYEKRFGEPILQVACKPFQPVAFGVDRNLLALLFPTSLCLLNVERCGSGGDSHEVKEQGSKGEISGIYYRCTVSFTAKFDYPVYNFTTGPFGGVDHHMICVQSMNGRWSIVDYNRVVCSRALPTSQFLAPGCLTYCKLRDSFLTCNTAHFLLCYTFINLTSAADAEQGRLLRAGRFDSSAVLNSTESSSEYLTPSWMFSLGEEALAIEVCRLTRGLEADDADIVVLCPYMLYVFSLCGVCRYVRPLSSEASCLCAYVLPNRMHNLLIGTWDGSVNVFSDVVLEWSARLTSGGAPIVLHVGKLCNIEGMILSLTVGGVMLVSYLGTAPSPRKPAPVLEGKALSYADMLNELRQVQRRIRSIHSEKNQPAAPTESAVAAVTSPTEAASRFSPDMKSIDGRHNISSAASKENGSASPMIIIFEPAPADQANGGFRLTLVLSLPKGDTCDGVDASDVRVRLKTTPPIVVEPSHTIIERVAQGATVRIPLSITIDPAAGDLIPSSLELTAIAVLKRRGACAVVKSMPLPLELVCKAVPPVRNTEVSMQINTDRAPAPSLLALFPELASSGNVRDNIMSVQYWNGAGVTMLVSKNAARFKLQGAVLEGLWVLASELVRRLQVYYRDDGAPLQFGTPEDPPVSKFLDVIDAHTAARKDLASAMNDLDRAAHLARSVQKRLLSRFRDRTPVEAEGLALLFGESHTVLQQATEKVCIAKLRQRQASAILNCSCQLMLMWSRLQRPEFFSANEGLAEALVSLFTCEIRDDDGVKWEEETETALSHILGITTSQAIQPVLKAGLNNNNLKKCISAVFDGIGRGTLERKDM